MIGGPDGNATPDAREQPGRDAAGLRTRLVAWPRRLAGYGRAFVRSFTEDPRLCFVALGVLAYVIYWSNLTIVRYRSLHADVFDLGLFYQTSWQVLHGPFTLDQIWQTFATEGITYVVFPLTLFASYPVLLIAQSVAIGICAFPVYWISARMLEDRTAALLLAVGFLVYFPVAGINWFDVHPETFFLPLFLFGYSAHLAGHPRVGYPLLALSGLARFPFAVYPLLFAALRLAGRRFTWLPLGPDPSPPYPRRYDLALIVLSLGVLAVSGAYFLTSSTSVSGFLHSGASAGAPSFDDRVVAVVLLGAPFLFLPALSPRWSLLLLPAAGLVLVSGNPYYNYPQIFFTQYTATIVPFLFLGFLDALVRIFPRSGGPPAPGAGPSPMRSGGEVPLRAGRFLRRRRRQAVVVTFTFLVALALVYQPWGPWNPDVSASYNLPYFTHENQTLYDTVQRVLGLIPHDSPNVLMQNNLPDVLPRPIGNHGTVLIPGETMAYNFTYLYRDAWVPAQIDYVIMDPYSEVFDHVGAFPYNISMEGAFRSLYASGAYGLMAEANGILLLGRGYSGSLEYYVPENLSIPTDALSVTEPSYRNGSRIVAEDVTNQTTVWFGPYAFVQPGLYDVTYQLRVSDNASSNFLKLEVLATGAAGPLNSSLVTGDAFPSTNAWTNVTVEAYFDNVYSTANFPANDVAWNGSLELGHIWVREVAPPSTTYTVGSTPEDRAVYRLLDLVPPDATVLVQPDTVAFLAGRPHVVSTSFDPRTGLWPAFLLGDPMRSGFDAVGAAPTLSLYHLAQAGLAQHTYRPLGLIAGVFLFTTGPGSGLAAYQGLNATYGPANLFVTVPTYRTSNAIRAVNVTDQSTVWFGPYEFLQPGLYAVTYRMMVSDSSHANFLKLDFLAGEAGTLFNSTRISGGSFPAVDVWTDLTVRVLVDNVYEFSNFPANDVDWAGTLELQSITLEQLGPP